MSITKIKQLEKDMYAEAARENLTFTQYLEKLARKGDIEGDLVKLGADQPKDSAGKPVDAFRQVLAKAGIRTKGALASTGDAFFTSPENKVLFPEFVMTTYRDYERQPRNQITLSDLVSLQVGIDGTSYKAGVIDEGQLEGLEFGRVAEGAELPVYTIVTAEREIQIYKYGGIVKATYEFVRRTRINVVARLIERIARQEQRRKVKQALQVALNGDGNSNPALNSATAGANWTLQDIIAMQIDGMENDADIDVLVGDRAEITAVLALVTPTDASSHVVTPQRTAYLESGTWPRPFGVPLRFAPTNSILTGSRKLLGIDSGLGLEQVTENGSQIVEADRIIDHQFERLAISENVGFAKPERVGFVTKTRPA